MPRPIRAPVRDAPTTIDAALALADLGYHVTPCFPRQKGARLEHWPTQILSPADVRTRFRPEDNLGLLLGTEVHDGRFLFAIDIDVDDPILIARARAALGGNPPAKRGSKGITYFAVSPQAVNTKKVTKVDPATRGRSVPLEILCKSYQTVIPPSIHPDTGRPYEWVGQSLLDVPPSALTLVDVTVFDELECAVKAPDSPLFALNDMQWNGPGGAAGVDDVLRSSTASMVARGWDDDAIQGRVARAVALMLERIEPETARQWDESIHHKRLDSLIEDARKKGFDQRKSKRLSRQEMRTLAAERLVEQYGGLDFLWRDGSLLRRYSEGHWTAIDPRRLEHDALALDNRSWAQPDDARAIIGLINGWAGWHDSKTPNAVCFKGGLTYFLDEREVKPWAPGDRLTYQLPFEYDNKAKDSPNYDKLLLSVFHVDREMEDGRSDDELEDDVGLSIGVFEEFMALSMVRDLSFQKMLVIQGPTGTGKSTLLSFIAKFFGQGMVSAVPIDKLHDERHLTALDGKLLNISVEVNSDAYVDDSKLKSIVGGDQLTVRRLYEEPIDVMLQVRLAVACNKVFRTRDTSGAIERRMLLLSCGKKLAADERDMRLTQKLAPEMPAVFNRLANAYSILRARGDFKEPLGMKRALSEFTTSNNHVLEWLQDRTHQGQQVINPGYKRPPGDKGWCDSGLLFKDYEFWAKDGHGFKPMNSSNFGYQLRELGYPSFNKKIPGGKVIKVRSLSLAHGQGVPY